MLAKCPSWKLPLRFSGFPLRLGLHPSRRQMISGTQIEWAGKDIYVRGVSDKFSISVAS